MNAKPVKFPYASMESAKKDEFKKIGGEAGAFALMVKGYKTRAWRQKHAANVKAQNASA